jgi:8-oxo-dGTP diphosphatase
MAEPLTRPGWPRPGASAAILRDDTVLLVERGKGPRGIWSLPGGHIEPGERANEAAAREVLEETGVACEIAGLIDIQDVFRHEDDVLTAHYVLAVYYGRPISDAVPSGQSDAADARYVPRHLLPSYNMTPNTLNMIERAFSLALPR